MSRLLVVFPLLLSLAFSPALADDDRRKNKNLKKRVERLESQINGKLTNGFKSLPGAAFDLDWQKTEIAQSRGITFPKVEGRYDRATFGTSMFTSTSGDLWFETTGADNYVEANFVPGFHILCDPDVHIGFLPREASLILANGKDMLALRTPTAVESANPYNEQATGACLRRRDDGSFEPTTYVSFSIVNAHGRFECAHVIEPLIGVYQPTPQNSSADLLNIQMTLVLGDHVISSESIGKKVNERPLSGLIHVPQACH